MNHTTSKPSSDTQKKIERLQKRFQGIVSFLHKTTINKHGKDVNLTELPWYLFIGPNGAGKTTLLANSNVHFLLAKKFKQENLKNLAPSDICDWWITRDLVLLDIPSSYMIPPSSLWNTLLKSVKEVLHKNSLQGVVIALNLPELIKEQTIQSKTPLVIHLKRRILELRDQFGKDLPCHLIISKCDLIAGFADFFSESSSEELSQAWGVTIPPINENEKWPEVFSSRFNHLIKRLNKQLIWRLHQERDSTAKSSIKDFPLHIERLKENINQFFKSLNIPDLCIRSVYLTCGKLDESKKQLPYLQSISHSLTTFSQPAQPRSYFIHQVIHHGLAAVEPRKNTHLANKKWMKPLTYAASILSVVVAASFLGYDFHNGLQRTNLVKNDLTQYQLNMNQQGDHIASAVSLLNELKQSAEQSPKVSFYSNQSKQSAASIYSQALETIALTEAKTHLEKALKTVGDKNPEQTYLLLKSYLMLTDSKHFQPEIMERAFQKILPPSTNKNAVAAFVDHIHTGVKLNDTYKLNLALIESTRKQLTNLPSNTLAFVILKNIDNNYQDSDINLDAHTNGAAVFSSSAVSMQIPIMFTAPALQKIMSEEISTAAIESLQGNWVLGIRTGYTANQFEVNNLTTVLRNQYLANYVDIWESLLANIKLATPASLTDAEATVAALTSDHSPLLQLLNVIRENTSSPLITNASPKLQALGMMLSAVNNNQQSKLYPIFISLKELHFYLNTILTAPSETQAAYLISIQRTKNIASDPITQIHTIAEQTPEPMKTWLNNLATQSQRLISQKAKEDDLCKVTGVKKNAVCLG